MKFYLIALLAVQILLISTDVRAQGRERYPEGTVRVLLTDGTRHLGVVESEASETIEFVTLSGVRMTIPRDQIVSIEGVAGEKFFRSDPNQSRLLFAPTARPLPHGGGYVAVYQVFFPFVAVGIRDILTLAGGISLLPGLDNQLIYAAPKATFYSTDRMQLGAGAIIGTSTGGDGSAGLMFGLGTFGRSRASITVGAGLGFVEAEISTRPILVIAGEYQLSNSTKLVSENYVIPAYRDAIVAMGGIRFFGDKLAADLALITLPALVREADGFPFIPWLGFAYNFGR